MTNDEQTGISPSPLAVGGQTRCLDDVSGPLLSIVIVTAGGLDDLAVALPGLRSQTIVEKIELLIVAAVGRVSNRDILDITAIGGDPVGREPGEGRSGGGSDGPRGIHWSP